MPATTKSHLPALDGLRGIAVLLVLWGHLPVLGRVDRLLKSVTAPHYLGVEIFFVLSGFLITRILRFDLTKGNATSLKTVGQFYARRALRIFPIYYLTLLVLALAWPQPLGMGKYVAYVQNLVFAFHGQEGPPLNHTWSLAVEEHFYLVWPVVVMALTRTRYLVPAATIGLLGGWLAMAVHARLIPGGAGAVTYLTPYRTPTLLAGALLAIGEVRLRERPRAVTLLALATLAIGAGTLLLAKTIDPPIALYLAARNVGLAGVAIGIFCLAWRTTLGASAIVLMTRRFLETNILRFVGRISYGLYLYHFPIYGALGIGHGDDAGQTLGHRVARGCGAVAVTFGLATLSFFAIELPILKFKHRFDASSSRRSESAR